MFHVIAVDIVTVSIRRHRGGERKCDFIHIHIYKYEIIITRAVRDFYLFLFKVRSNWHDDKQLRLIIYLWDDIFWPQTCINMLHWYAHHHHPFLTHVTRNSENCIHNNNIPEWIMLSSIMVMYISWKSRRPTISRYCNNDDSVYKI